MNRRHSVSSVVCVICSLILTLGAWGVVEAVGYPFADDFESGLGNWTAEAPWGETTAFYSSPAHSATDSPSTLYGTSVDASLTLGSSVDLSSATRPVLRFYHRYQIEDGYDFGYVEVSTDGGSTWDAPVATYTGARAQWVRDQIDLAVYAGYCRRSRSIPSRFRRHRHPGRLVHRRRRHRRRAGSGHARHAGDHHSELGRALLGRVSGNRFRSLPDLSINDRRFRLAHGDAGGGDRRLQRDRPRRHHRHPQDHLLLQGDGAHHVGPARTQRRGRCHHPGRHGLPLPRRRRGHRDRVVGGPAVGAVG